MRWWHPLVALAVVGALAVMWASGYSVTPRPVTPEDFQSESLGEHLFHEGHDCTVVSPINPDASVRVRCDKGVDS